MLSIDKVSKIVLGCSKLGIISPSPTLLILSTNDTLIL
jgi:hypothetical protein